jgi:hypothetical protein
MNEIELSKNLSEKKLPKGDKGELCLDTETVFRDEQ